jgi:hypothetical protein
MPQDPEEGGQQNPAHLRGLQDGMAAFQPWPPSESLSMKHLGLSPCADSSDSCYLAGDTLAGPY